MTKEEILNRHVDSDEMFTLYEKGKILDAIEEYASQRENGCVKELEAKDKELQETREEIERLEKRVKELEYYLSKVDSVKYKP